MKSIGGDAIMLVWRHKPGFLRAAANGDYLGKIVIRL
jgi:hypothetical protein